jgi:peroxiredoxin
MTAIGLIFVLAGLLSYVGLLFVLRRFTYRTWMFDAIVGAGMAVALVGWALGGSGAVASAAAVLGGAWFLATRHELKLVGSKGLRLRAGDRVPAFTVSTIDGKPFTDRDLIAHAPALLVLYCGWWCPSSKSQLDELARQRESLGEAGLTIFAASVDGPTEAAPLQQQVGEKITILCSVSESLLDEVGVRDQRGAPWYDRILFGAAQQDIAMPAALVIDGAGRIVFAYRSTRVDDRAQPAEILNSLSPSHRTFSKAPQAAR